MYCKETSLRCFLTALSLTVLAAACTRLDRTEDYIRVQAAVEKGGIIQPQVKGAPSNTLGSSFSAWAYAYTGSIGTPNYLCGETFSQVDATSSYKSADVHASLASSYTVKWWAISPVSPAGVTGLPTANSSGSPSFSYTTPATVTSQQDLLVASPAVQAGDAAAPNLVFSHVLGGLQFCTSSTAANVPPCTINSISVSNVQNAATWTDGIGWSGKTGSATFTINPAHAVSAGATNTLMHQASESMLLLPQTLTGTLTINFTPAGLDPVEASVILPDITLTAGKISVLRIVLTNDAEISIEAQESLFFGEKPGSDLQGIDFN